MQRVVDFLEMLRRLGQRLGPYVMIEIFLPGGSLFALMLFLYQRRRAGGGRAAPAPLAALMRLGAGLVPQTAFGVQPCYARPSRVLRSAIDTLE